MDEDNTKPWKKTEDIPKRFDELPPEPGWVPVADVIRTSREDEARQEAKKEKFKVKPPVDSDSELSESDVNQENRGREERTPVHKEKRSHTPPKTVDNTSMPPSVDNVTQAMVEWALSPDHYPQRKPKPAHHTQIKPPAGMPSPSPLLQDKTHAAKERPIGKLPTVAPEEFIKFVSPELQLDVPKSPSTHKSHNPPGAARRSPQQPARNHREQRLPYDEPSPDYDDDYKKYYSRHNKQYYREGRPNEDFYNHDRYGYEDRGAADPYRYNSARDGYQEHQQYPSQQGHDHDYSNYEYREPQYSYEAQRSSYQQPEYSYEAQRSSYQQPEYSYEAQRSPYQQPEYPYEAQRSPYQQPEYSYEAQRSPYQQPSPYYRSEPQQYSREYQQPHSSYDVLY